MSTQRNEYQLRNDDMEQMNVPEEIKVEINFDDKNLPEAVRTLQPLIFEKDNSFCCLLGPDPQEGVVGYGKTTVEALTDWEAKMRKRIIYHKKGDKVAEFILDKLNVSKDDFW